MRAPRWLVPLALVLLRAEVAHAHAPAVLDAATPFVVDDPLLSHALYGRFAATDEVFVVQLHSDRIALPFELLVPHRSELKAHRPAFAVVGPGLPPVSPADAARLPRPLPAGAGAFIDWNDTPKRPVIFESFLRRVFWSTGSIALLLPAGDVEIWVWSPEHTPGPFVLGFGVEEGELDYGDVVAHWSDYAY